MERKLIPNVVQSQKSIQLKTGYRMFPFLLLKLTRRNGGGNKTVERVNLHSGFRDIGYNSVTEFNCSPYLKNCTKHSS